MPKGHVALNRALSKLGVLSRSQAIEAIRAGRVSVNGRIVRDPACAVMPEQVHVAIDAVPAPRPAPWRTIALHKPRGVVTTRRDPQGRRTVYDVIGPEANGLVAVGRLDLATSGLLLLTSDTRLSDWITDPANAVPRRYVVTVRGEVTAGEARDLPAAQAVVRKASRRESHLIVELHQGRNREIRRMFAAAGHEVTRLHRVSLGGLALSDLDPGRWRALTRAELRAAFPECPGFDSSKD